MVPDEEHHLLLRFPIVLQPIGNRDFNRELVLLIIQDLRNQILKSCCDGPADDLACWRCFSTRIPCWVRAVANGTTRSPSVEKWNRDGTESIFGRPRKYGSAIKAEGESSLNRAILRLDFRARLACMPVHLPTNRRLSSIRGDFLSSLTFRAP